MLSWLRSQCPLETAEKAWIEWRMRWLAGKLGLDRLQSSEVILPHAHYFPDRYTGTLEDGRRIFDRVCGYMNLDPCRYELEILPDASMGHYAGLYEGPDRPRILLARQLLADPEWLVATIAHELAHDILLGSQLVSLDENDHEATTDLAPVYFGMGIFLANRRSFNNSSIHNRPYIFSYTQDYMTPRMFSYALALFAYARGETRPAWARYLRPHAAESFKGGLRHLQKTGDTLFHPNIARRYVDPPTVAQAIEWLTTSSAMVRLLTLRDVASLDSRPIALVNSVMQCLSDRDIDVQIEAARVLALFGEAAHRASPDLIRCLASKSAILRINAAAALSAVGGPVPQVVAELTRLLQDTTPDVVDVAAEGLCRYAPFAAEAVPALVEALRKTEIRCGPSDNLAAALVAIDPPADVLRSLLDPIDPEIRDLMIQSLQTARLGKGER
jgi:hypothetical protein